jgi:hypothetical protein
LAAPGEADSVSNVVYDNREITSGNWKTEPNKATEVDAADLDHSVTDLREFPRMLHDFQLFLGLPRFSTDTQLIGIPR